MYRYVKLLTVCIIIECLFVFRSRVPTQTQLEDIDAIKQTARLLALDIADYMVKPSANLKCRHAATMRRVVDELSSRHEIVFSSIARKLGSRVADDGPSAARWRHTFIAVASELFADGTHNWGRIVTIYAFAGWLVRQHCTAETNRDELARTIATTAGDFVADKLADWICRQGGWVNSCLSDLYLQIVTSLDFIVYILLLLLSLYLV